jgi:hypothetical protein
MNDLPHQDLPPDEQLRQALNGFVAIFEALLRRNSDYGAAIEQFRSRQHADSERIAALERSMATDRAALERVRGVFADLARLSAPTAGGSEVTAAAGGDQQEPSDAASTPNGHLSSPFPRQAPAGS